MTLFSQKSKSPQTPQKSSEDFFGVQAKLSIGKSNDKYEVEADKMADKVVTNKQKNNTDSFFNPSPILQKKQDNELQKQEETESQEKPLAKTITPVIQLATDKEEAVQEKKEEEIQTKEEDQKLQTSAGTDDAVAPNSSLESNLNSSKGGGTALPENTKTEMESGFGADFSNVKVHTDSTAVQMNKELGSQAFANGNDIYFNEGTYNPDSQEGKHLLAHELTHTVQQGSSKSGIQKLINNEATIQKQEEDQNTQNNNPKQKTENQSSNTNENNQTATAETNDVNNDANSNQTTTTQTNDVNNDANSNQTTTTQTNDVNNNQSTSSLPNNQATSQDSSANTTEPSNTNQKESKNANQPQKETNQGENSEPNATPNTQTNSVEATTSGGSESGGSGFATYDLFLAFVEKKKQDSKEYFKNKKQELTDGINEEKKKARETVETETDRLIETKRATLKKINTTHTETKKAITSKRDTEIKKANDLAIAEILKIDQIVLAKKDLIVSKGEEKATSIISKANEESINVAKATSANIKQIDLIISQKSSQYSHKENASDVKSAALKSKSETVQKITESGSSITSKVTNHAEKLASNYREDASNISSKFDETKQESKDAINKKRDETVKTINEAAQTALEALDKETGNLTEELGTGIESQIVILRKIPLKTDSELDDILKLTLDNVIKSETSTESEIDKFKDDVKEIYWYNDEVAAAQVDLDKAINENQTDVATYVTNVIKKVSTVVEKFTTDFKTTQDTINNALTDTGTSYDTSAEKLKTETIKAIDDAALDSEAKTKMVAGDLEKGLQSKIDESDTKWNSQLTKDVSNMHETVSDALAKQSEIVTTFSSNLDAEFNRSSSWWDDVVDFVSGMAAGFWEGFTSLLGAIWDAMGTLIFWIIVIVIVIIIVILVFVFEVAFATILAVLVVVGVIVGVLAAIYYIYKAITTEGLTPYERGKLFGRALFEIAIALVGTGVYARLVGWLPRIARVAEIVARVGSWTRFIRIVARVKDVKAFVALIDSVADLEKLMLLMDKIKDLEVLVKLLTTNTTELARIVEVLLSVEKAEELLLILAKADNLVEILVIIEKGIELGNTSKIITLLSKTKQLVKLVQILGFAGDDFGRVINALEKAKDINKMIIAMERVGASNLGKLIGLIETVDDVTALIRIVTKAADFGTLLRVIGEATGPNINKLIALCDKVNELDKLIIAFDALKDTNRLVALFTGVVEIDKLVTIISRTNKIEKLVGFMEGLTDINKAIPVLERLGTEVDDFVKLLDEAGMTIQKLEKILYYENLSVAKFKDLLAKAGGVVDDLILVLDEIKDLEKLTRYITHFGDFLKVKTLVAKAKTSGMVNSPGTNIIAEFFESCVANGFKKVPELEQFFEKVKLHGPSTTVWREVLGYGVNFVNESVGNLTQFSGRSAVGSGSVASKNFVLSNGSTVTVTVEMADINHMASRHTWSFFAMVLGNAKPSNSMWALGTDLNAVKTMAINALNSPEVSAKISTMLSGGNDLVTVGSNEARIALNGPNGIVSMYPTASGTVNVPKKLMQAAVLLWKSL